MEPLSVGALIWNEVRLSGCARAVLDDQKNSREGVYTTTLDHHEKFRTVEDVHTYVRTALYAAVKSS